MLAENFKPNANIDKVRFIPIAFLKIHNNKIILAIKIPGLTFFDTTYSSKRFIKCLFEGLFINHISFWESDYTPITRRTLTSNGCPLRLFDEGYIRKSYSRC